MADREYIDRMAFIAEREAVYCTAGMMKLMELMGHYFHHFHQFHRKQYLAKRRF